MESGDAQLHPNWWALARVNFPLKRFVRGLELQSNEANQDQHQSSLPCEMDGVEVQKFYEELTDKFTSNQSVITTLPVDCQSISKKGQSLKFNRVKFFRYATSNNIEELARFDYQPNDVNACDTFGWTALMMAACEGAKNAVRMLLQLGADKNIKEKCGRTALDIAKQKGHEDIAVLLKRGLEFEISRVDEKRSPSDHPTQAFYCSICAQTFSDTTRLQHQTSTLHQFNTKSTKSKHKLDKFNISSKNRGLQMMVKQGWDKESGLGPTKDGRLYPIKTVIRKKRTGLGTDQEPARITHFGANDLEAVKHNNSSVLPTKKKRSRNDIRSEKLREWKRERRLRKELS
ncbi:PREDICTED: G patch domain and ankyrin repeat-containing protein 1 homolog [Rhagoletis zephyria]|uniref:G patch domain and ankyrin repeat-containing protein 1 homolog n=1 Tax=Rhagoletis zephyria TaxID=28612 RepID=UPI00081128CD|nr:PREDICTED: G patch domain and ankyrin repeat-containing protein 1 homolog [Rhagoletis zephyria]